MSRFAQQFTLLAIVVALVAPLYFVQVDTIAPAPKLVVPAPEVTPTLATSTPAQLPTPPVRTPQGPLPAYKATMTTVFWVGEGADASNDFIANDESYWDDQWQENFGGVDDPTNRCGYYPCAFVPKENPFYFALPYGEFEPNTDTLKASALRIPWASDTTQPLLKNRWIEVAYHSTTCYAQWQDVGPSSTDDFAYVFGTAAPINTFGVRAGLDVSPALWDCLGLETNATTTWRFVDAKEVPPGPWREIITTSGISWE